MLNNYFRQIVYAILFLFIVPFYAQTYSIKKLDSLTDKYRIEGNIAKSISLNENALQQYKKSDNKEGIIAAQINLGGLSWFLHEYKQSLKYLEDAENNLRKIKNFTLCAKLYGEYGRNYASLGLLEQSNNNLDWSIIFAKQISERKERERLLYFYYTWKIGNFEELRNTDSLNFYQRKRLELTAQPLTFVYIAEKHLKNKKLDTAEYYLNKAANLAGDFSLYQKSITLFTFGKLYTEKQEYEKALSYYQQSLEISEQLSRKTDIKSAYKVISDTYKHLNNVEKKNEYLEKYSDIKDSIDAAEREALSIPIDKIIKQENEKEKNERIKYFIAISAIIIASVIIVAYIVRKYIKKQKETEEIISETLHETDELKSKLNEAFEELSKLAMTNDPFFLTRFKEVYPEFYETLTSRYPNLTANDIKFSAFLRLNLSTKTIAQYKNISVRTIESRKYRLRKKLDLSSDIDLNKWMMDL
ncbi:tetratricopeptide repeat protein [Chryseobacterium sp. JUb7]|uniref:tetratricopeptide repeat protein n=1 Tax=Chryseobacterium sp. JUb7 TaxID=2940599 RepID=UPI0021687A38|nr:tetratricopeptide repeat protein [Chryseobacterium sp. JUb7]MCS3529909.1 DNA-binding CsgD family transcriptional regulator [Chryseobacterium sp. JUb7]